LDVGIVGELPHAKFSCSNKEGNIGRKAYCHASCSEEKAIS
jgi:hypothetical protein